jgi:hypothetical protein
MFIDYDKVKDFWRWFQSNADEFLKNQYNNELIEKIDKFIDSFNVTLDWEIGPVEGASSEQNKVEQYLCISPCLNEDLVPLTREIISLAPACDSWLFLPAKPAKGWFPEWNMLNEVNQAIAIDASDWKYLLYLFDDGTYEMDVYVDNVDGNANTRLLAAEIAITNLLGEDMLMNTIKNIQVVPEISQGDLNKWSDLENLKRHLDQLK